MSEELAAETNAFGIRTTIVEPGAFHTGFSERSVTIADNRLPEVYPITDEMLGAFSHFDSPATGDPRKAAQIIFEAVESENPPFRLPLGQDAFDAIDAKLEQIKQEIAPWRTRASQTAFDAAATA